MVGLSRRLIAAALGALLGVLLGVGAVSAQRGATIQ